MTREKAMGIVWNNFLPEGPNKTKKVAMTCKDIVAVEEGKEYATLTTQKLVWIVDGADDFHAINDLCALLEEIFVIDYTIK